MVKLNETPVRTSRNFNINNIKLEDVNIPEDIESFSNIKITGETSKVNINSSNNNFDLSYGLGDLLTNQVREKANQNLKITVDNKTSKEIGIEFKFNKENLVLVDNIDVTVNEKCKGTLILKYTSDNNIEGFHNGILRVSAKNESELNVIVLNLMNEFSNNFLAIENVIDSNAKVKYTVIDFGAKNSITNYYSNLLGDLSDNSINTIYLGKGNQLFDLNYIAELRGEKSNIEIEVQGALKDNSKKHFKGTIDFKKGCKKSTGNENESCMLLSDTARSLALPMLLCSEEEVEGNHSSSAGKIGEKELFYIMSRGFELKEAMKLMVRARFNKILSNIKNEELKNEIIGEIDKRLD